MEKKVKVDATSHLILARTSKDQIKDGITVITKGEGVRVFDQDGKRYLDLEAGGTRPVHVGYGREEMARAAYDQMCELCYFTPMAFATEPPLKLAEVMSQIAPTRSTDSSSFVMGRRRGIGHQAGQTLSLF